MNEKSLMDANMSFLKKHEDSLMHRTAVAEMLHLLEPNKKSEAVKLIEESSNNMSINDGPVTQWKLMDCIAVHKVLESVLVDKDASTRWKTRCAEYFPNSVYFEGSRSSAVSNAYLNSAIQNSENGAADHTEITGSVGSNGKLESFKDLQI